MNNSIVVLLCKAQRGAYAWRQGVLL